MRSVFFSVIAVWFFASPVGAWHEAGHKMTAEIAFDLLADAQQLQFAKLLRAHTRFEEDFAAQMPEEIVNSPEIEKARWIFAQASIWPELIRNTGESVGRQYHRSTWHYINLPVYLTEQDQKELRDRLDHNLSTEFSPPLRRNLNIIQALQGNLLVWRDESVSDAVRAIALCWILHLTGDIHEPLHTVALFSRAYFPEGDRGGNLIAIKLDGDVTNLHSVWDGLANRYDYVSPNEYLQKVLANDIASIRSIEKWARDQHKLAVEFAYSEEVKSGILGQVSRERNPEIRLSAEYLATAEKIARSQVIIAGHRIAALLTK